MIVLDLKLKGIYGFDDFSINFTYPKKLVKSILGEEHLEGRERFRYKKVNVLMGTNATGKTSLGRALLKICSYINSGNDALLLEMATDEHASFQIDFVNEGFTMHRLSADIRKEEGTVDVRYYAAEIGELDFYERCVDKLQDFTDQVSGNRLGLKKCVGEISSRFAYPEIASSLNTAGANKKELLKTMRAVLSTLDPTLTDIDQLDGAKDTFIIRRRGTEILIQEGKLLNREVLSSGTAEGIDVAVFLASMLSKDKTFYYCDEHFSYIHSEIEKAIFGLMMERIGENEQLIFTTHNMDMLDLNLPKHAFTFLKKEVAEGQCEVMAIPASMILKKNTDSVRIAVDNDMFGTLPDLSALDDLDMGWPDEL
ncbi:MAG: ATP-binding protein [Clostridia bacterium]|nr:ATP-binding protein [Clostridia bacterium]MBQ9212270.1 ATP-binding protein [Clostridia bacterium]